MTTMNYESRLEKADQHLDQAYETALEAIETSGNLSDSVESRLDSMYDIIESELNNYKQDLATALVDLEEAGSLEELEPVTECLESAGQALVNASYATTVMMNKAEGVVYNGEEAFESNVSAITIGAEPDATPLIRKAVGGQADAFEMYDDTLQNIAGELGKANQEYGVQMHLDIGLGQQQPEIEL